MTEGLLALAVFGPFAVLGVFWLALLVRAERSERFLRQQRLAHERETIRLLDGLPPHPRCLCARCRAWRQVPGNAEQLRLRGLR